jgi:HD superfamily phosphohydrolase
LEAGGEHIFEALILARYQMNTQVYFHRIRRIYDKYLTEFMTSWGKEHYKTTDEVLQYDDMDLLVEMKAEAKKDGPRSQVARRIIERDHHQQIFETGDSANYLANEENETSFREPESGVSKG